MVGAESRGGWVLFGHCFFVLYPVNKFLLFFKVLFDSGKVVVRNPPKFDQVPGVLEWNPISSLYAPSHHFTLPPAPSQSRSIHRQPTSGDSTAASRHSSLQTSASAASARPLHSTAPTTRSIQGSIPPSDNTDLPLTTPLGCDVKCVHQAAAVADLPPPTL